jgi:hypothetical protein
MVEPWNTWRKAEKMWLVIIIHYFLSKFQQMKFFFKKISNCGRIKNKESSKKIKKKGVG